MTTVGYGDKAPRTFMGRLIGIVWMFVAVIVISSFTAGITSSLTVSQLENRIRSMEDLRAMKVGSLPGSTSEEFLQKSGVPYTVYSTLDAGLRALAEGGLDAVVYDAPILNYTIKNKFQGDLALLPKTFESQQYGIALTSGSLLRERINQSLLRILQSPEWDEIVQNCCNYVCENS